MQVARFKWQVAVEGNHKEQRYCHGCGQMVFFEDSLMRRQNANGKNIFHFAIYKCPKNHTWNKKLDQFKARGDLYNQPVEKNQKAVNQKPIVLKPLWDQGIRQVEIQMETTCRVRLDKILSDCIGDVSRTQVANWFEKGNVSVNGVSIQKKYMGQGQFKVIIRF